MDMCTNWYLSITDYHIISCCLIYLGWIGIGALWSSLFFGFYHAMFVSRAILRHIIAIGKRSAILDNLKLLSHILIDVVNPSHVDNLIPFDIKERAWDAADCLRLAAISAVPVSSISTVVELGIVGIGIRFCSLDPNNVLIDVVSTISVHKLFQPL